MDTGFVERLMEIVERSCLAELEYSDGSARVRIVRSRIEPAGPARVRTQSAQPPAGEHKAGAAPTDPGRGLHHTVAGVVGVFYRAPAQGARAFVSVGDVVEIGQTLGMIEAMKMLSAVEADRGGRVVEIAVADGGQVRAGETLFVIDPET